MSKTFNVNGICYPNEHYMVNIDSKLAQIKQLVDEKKYFVINRARQYGKTTTLNMLVKYLADKYTVFFISFEGLGETAFESETAFCGTICELLYDTVLYEEVPTIDDTVKQIERLKQGQCDALFLSTDRVKVTQSEHIRGLSYKYYEGSEKDTSQGKAVWVIVARYDNRGLIDILENLSDVKTVEMCRKKL